jgi:hypothetical protein
LVNDTLLLADSVIFPSMIGRPRIASDKPVLVALSDNPYEIVQTSCHGSGGVIFDNVSGR